jgi:hypothetical protein
MSLREILETRLDAIEKAAEVFSDNLNRVPSVLDREISKVSSLTEERFSSLTSLVREKEERWRDVEKRNQMAVTTALDANKAALEVLRQRLLELPDEHAQNIDHLRGIQDEKFASIQRQFSERDERVAAQAASSKVAVDAALSAQKEAAASQNASNAQAIAKGEAAITKQLDGMAMLQSNSNAALTDKIASLASRLDRLEGRDTGQGKSQATLIAVAAVVVSVVVGGFAISNSFRLGSGGGQSYPSPGPTGSVTVPIPGTPR